MMEIRLNLYQADRDFQVEIGGGGFGYRLFGPKFDGSSRLIKSVILSERDKEEIVRFVKPDAQAVERELAMKQDDWLKECQENDRLRAALAAAQGEVERLRVAIEAGVCLADFVAGERDMDKCEDCQVSECCSCCIIVAGRFLKKVPHDVAMEIAAQAQGAFVGKP